MPSVSGVGSSGSSSGSVSTGGGRTSGSASNPYSAGYVSSAPGFDGTNSTGMGAFDERIRVFYKA